MYKLYIHPVPMTAVCQIIHDGIPPGNRPFVLTFQPDVDPVGGNPRQSVEFPDDTPDKSYASLTITAPGKIPLQQRGMIRVWNDGTATFQAHDFQLQDDPQA